MTAEAHTELPYPGDELVYRVTGADEVTPEERRAWFFESGRRSVAAIESALAVVGRDARSFAHLLDFGCGPGRVLLWLRDLADAGTTLHGTDIDARAIRWATANVPWATFTTNEPLPPLPLGDGAIDLVVNHSVFTHLDEEYQDRWLAELHRVTRPGAILLLSVNGAHAFGEFERASRENGGDPAPVRAALERDGIVFLREDSWLGSAFPDFYHSTFHDPGYVMERWSWFFDVRAYLPRHALEHQDLVVLERRDVPLPGGAPPRASAPRREPEYAPPPGSALDAAASLLAREPGPAARDRSRFGPAGIAARRAVLRLLKPYWTSQRELDHALYRAVARLTERESAAAGETSSLRDGVLRQSDRVSRLELELLDRIDALSARVDELERGRDTAG